MAVVLAKGFPLESDFINILSLDRFRLMVDDNEREGSPIPELTSTSTGYA